MSALSRAQQEGRPSLLRRIALLSKAQKFGAGLESKHWAIGTSVWKRVSPEKKQKYIGLATKRLGKKAPKANYWAHKPPTEFVMRIAYGKQTRKSLCDEFGSEVYDLYKALTSQPLLYVLR